MKESRKVPVRTTAFILICIVVIFIAVSYILTRGVDNDEADTPVKQTQQNTSPQTEPSNPNVTGGSTGTGNGSEQNNANPTLNPSGGVDTD